MEATRLRRGASAFVVEELPAYEPCGEGEHLFLLIEKRGLATDVAAEALARACGRRAADVGWAGRKDRHAVTRQWFSVHHGSEPDGELLSAAIGEAGAETRIDVLESSRHTNKLKPGHLRGNRFRLTIDGIESDAQRVALEERLALLAREGLPNRFGPQRFGTSGSTLRAARAWASGDAAGAVRELIDPSGAWQPGEPPPAGYVPGAVGKIVGALRRDPHKPERALRAAGKRLLGLLASAAQSAVFNAVLDARHEAGLLHTLRAGDVGCVASGASFVCAAEDVADANARSAPGRLEVRTTGPMPGRVRFGPTPEIEAEERAWSRETAVDWSWFASDGPLRSHGERRPLVVAFLEPPRLATAADAKAEAHELELALPKGSFATEVLRAVEIAIPSPRGSSRE